MTIFISILSWDCFNVTGVYMVRVYLSCRYSYIMHYSTVDMLADSHLFPDITYTSVCMKCAVRIHDPENYETFIYQVQIMLMLSKNTGYEQTNCVKSK